jgi:hypothetical protein
MLPVIFIRKKLMEFRCINMVPAYSILIEKIFRNIFINLLISTVILIDLWQIIRVKFTICH